MESQNAPSESPRESSGWRGEASRSGRTGASFSSPWSLWLCATIPGCSHPLPSLVPWARLTCTNTPAVLESPTFPHPLCAEDVFSRRLNKKTPRLAVGFYLAQDLQAPGVEVPGARPRQSGECGSSLGWWRFLLGVRPQELR